MRHKSRLVKVIRLHLANQSTYIVIPLVVVGATFALSMALYGVLLLGLQDEAPRELYGLGGFQFVPFYYGVTVGIQAMMYTYPFAMAMSLTRREYINGTTGLAALFAGGLATMYAVGRALEEVTDGFGIGFHYFGLAGWFAEFGWWQQWLFLTGLCLMLFMGGFCCTTVFKRGGAMRLVIELTAWTMGLVGLIALVTWQEWWPTVGEWFLALTPALAGGWMLVCAGLLALGSYWSIRKAVP
ncbi:MAG: hypothetical protein LBD70_00120 [Bifidobacteriaceae bacterium]|jgi:hypothetical protein|nr:hypothetical protein [Bifidobacteriaceae bacterium]